MNNKDKTKNRLFFSEAALGETTANLDKIYERIDQERESIYSNIASLERRVVLRSGLSSRKNNHHQRTS